MVELPQLSVQQSLAASMQGCPAIQAELNATAAPGVRVTGPLQVNLQEEWEDKKRIGMEISWNGKREEETQGKHFFFLCFHKNKLGRSMPFPSAHCSQKLTRVTRNKSKTRSQWCQTSPGYYSSSCYLKNQYSKHMKGQIAALCTAKQQP